MPLSVNKTLVWQVLMAKLVQLLTLNLITFQWNEGSLGLLRFNSQGFDHEDSQPVTGSIIVFHPSPSIGPYPWACITNKSHSTLYQVENAESAVLG